MENSFRKECWKALKRLLLVGFSVHIRHFRKMVGNVARKCGYSYAETRNPSGQYALRFPLPSKGEFKSNLAIGIKVPLWHYRTYVHKN